MKVLDAIVAEKFPFIFNVCVYSDNTDGTVRIRYPALSSLQIISNDNVGIKWVYHRKKQTSMN